MIANLEPYMRSKLDAIHLLALFEYPLMEEYCIDNILAPFCDELKELSKVNNIVLQSSFIAIVIFQGHYFNIHGQQMWFQGALPAFIGDTPANDRIGGYRVYQKLIENAVNA